MLDSRERAALSNAFLSQKVATTQRLVTFARTYWEGMGSWSDADVERFLEFVVPRIEAGRASVANLTAVYLARIAEVDPIAAVNTSDLRGLTAAEVYRRPVATMRTEWKAKGDFPAAIKASTDRLASLVSTDMALAQQKQTAATTASSSAFEGGFRRTLTGSENCAKCYIASTQRYHRGNLLPIHPGCDCGVEPLKPDENVGQVIDADRLESTHDWVQDFAGTSDRGARVIDGRSAIGDDYRDLLITHEHGEYGPTLAWRAQHFTGPADI